MQKVYLPGLNGVRFFAALLVIIDHTELFKSYFGYEPLWPNSYSSFLGGLGVTVFFVLSGFLITYLLLTEQLLHPIKIKHFYFRRILRIWPLYYLIVLIAFFIIPHLEFFNISFYSSDMSNYSGRLALFIGMLANVAFIYFPTVPFANILWSVSIEEQFYLFWPHIVKSKYPFFKISVLLLIIYVILKFGTYFLSYGDLHAFISITRFSSLIIGGIGAYIVFYRSPVLKHIYSRPFQVVLFLAFIVLLTNTIRFKYFTLFSNELISVVICFIILNISSNPKTILNLENSVFNYFGKISYGLYVYHLFAVVFILKLLPSQFPSINVSGPIGYPITIGAILLVTTVLSHISYYFYEKRFLVRKKHFSTIATGDLVRTDSI